MMRFALLFLAVLALATPAFAQLALTDTCAGQPTGTGSDTGPLNIIPGVPANALDNLDLTGTGCENLTGFDAVMCFVPESTCSPTFTFSPSLSSNAFVTVNVTVQPGTASCLDTVPSCDAGGKGASPGATVNVGPVTLNAGSLVCIYTASTVADDGTLLSNAELANCGALPVELQSVTVE